MNAPEKGMNVLWLSNILFPEPCRMLGLPEPVLGGWMYAGAQELMKAAPDLKLAAVMFYPGRTLRRLDGEAMTYYLVPAPADMGVYRKELEPCFREIRDIFSPDVVHIRGSEYPHSLAWVQACGAERTAVSIQGLSSVCAGFYMGGIPARELVKSVTFRDLLRRDTLFAQQRKIKARGRYERELFGKVRHVIGCTAWDRSHAWAMNPAARYHVLQPTLREPFYRHEWDAGACEKHTIFLSQSHYPLKGFHKVVEALPLVLRHYPDARVKVVGPDILSVPAWRRNGYARYLGNLMERLGVRDRFRWLGRLDAEQMGSQFRKAHVFVCPSMIENESNSLGEAQMVGTPCIASYAGGMMDSVSDGETGFLYRFEETEMLAMLVCRLFGDMDLCRRLSFRGRQASLERHDRSANAEQLKRIYGSIAGEAGNGTEEHEGKGREGPHAAIDLSCQESRAPLLGRLPASPSQLVCQVAPVCRQCGLRPRPLFVRHSGRQDIQGKPPPIRAVPHRKGIYHAERLPRRLPFLPALPDFRGPGRRAAHRQPGGHQQYRDYLHAVGDDRRRCKGRIRSPHHGYGFPRVGPGSQAGSGGQASAPVRSRQDWEQRLPGCRNLHFERRFHRGQRRRGSPFRGNAFHPFQ